MAVKGTASELIDLVRNLPGDGREWSHDQDYLTYRGVALWLRTTDGFKDNAEIAETLRALYDAAKSDVIRKNM